MSGKGNRTRVQLGKLIRTPRRSASIREPPGQPRSPLSVIDPRVNAAVRRGRQGGGTRPTSARTAEFSGLAVSAPLIERSFDQRTAVSLGGTRASRLADLQFFLDMCHEHEGSAVESAKIEPTAPRQAPTPHQSPARQRFSPSRPPTAIGCARGSRGARRCRRARCLLPRSPALRSRRFRFER